MDPSSDPTGSMFLFLLRINSLLINVRLATLLKLTTRFTKNHFKLLQNKNNFSVFFSKHVFLSRSHCKYWGAAQTNYRNYLKLRRPAPYLSSREPPHFCWFFSIEFSFIWVLTGFLHIESFSKEIFQTLILIVHQVSSLCWQYWKNCTQIRCWVNKKHQKGKKIMV